jgi:peptide deformylase
MSIVCDIDKLSVPCAKASLFDSAQIIEKLEYELSLNKSGIGLTANQIGIPYSVVIIRYNKIKINLVNPEIVEKHDLCEFHFDGCLSFPGHQITTARYGEVFIKDDLHPNGFVSVGMESVVMQHEIDHTLGITMFDREIKIPRVNDLCWCDDGKKNKRKYKKCHAGKRIMPM